MGSELINKFFEYDDEKIEALDDFVIPADWWSRHYEYAWAIKFLEPQDTIIDAGCGIEHPFKNYASKRVSKCYAVDVDARIKEFEDTDTMEFIHAEFCQLEDKIEHGSIDKIFCLSVLEHMHINNILNALKTFKILLKPAGKIILTMDYPMLGIDTLYNMVNEAGLIIDGSVDFEINKDKVIQGPYANLKCYRVILCKPEEEQIEQPYIQPKETKPRKPKEIK